VQHIRITPNRTLVHDLEATSVGRVRGEDGRPNTLKQPCDGLPGASVRISAWYRLRRRALGSRHWHFAGRREYFPVG
jgi:hypothetical protein